jgi:hypothetical protein
VVEYRKEVDGLLAAYANYKQLLTIESELSMKRAKRKIIGSIDEELVRMHEQTKQQLQSLSDSMTFSNPFVWIMYKFEAYKNEAQPIRTMRDFRIHCSKVGDICTKRFTFVNEQLVAKGERSLVDSNYYEDATLIDTLLEDRSINELMNDPVFMDLWNKYEFNTADGRVAKWESYVAKSL